MMNCECVRTGSAPNRYSARRLDPVVGGAGRLSAGGLPWRVEPSLETRLPKIPERAMQA
jgi:hypothetical protein